MGAAMGFALTQDSATALAVFLALGLGFAFPFMVLGFFPAPLRLLPRPGTWMNTLRQVLAFPMYGAALWLLWVLSQQAGTDGAAVALAAALVLAFGLWAFGRAQAANGRRRIAGFGIAVLALLGVAVTASYAANFAPPPAGVQATAVSADALPYEKYSAARLEALRGEGRPVFINATAAWCITCLVNERVALSGENLKRKFDQHKVAALKADWTNRDAEITALLAAQRRSGVPLYLYYAPNAREPIVLPQILTEATVVAALEPPR
jgi:thiol:disulfide interchange protein DsbD